MVTVPVPTFRGEATKRSARSHRRPITPPTTSTIESTAPTSWKCTCSGDTPWIALSTAARPVETFGLLALDVRRRLRHEAVVSVSCLTASLVHPREVFQEAVVARAAAILIFHNHPSGDPEPSAEDVALTRRLAQAGTLMGIEVLDHLVLGAGRFVSLKERGVL